VKPSIGWAFGKRPFLLKAPNAKSWFDVKHLNTAGMGTPRLRWLSIFDLYDIPMASRHPSGPYAQTRVARRLSAFLIAASGIEQSKRRRLSRADME